MTLHSMKWHGVAYDVWREGATIVFSIEGWGRSYRATYQEALRAAHYRIDEMLACRHDQNKTEA